MRIFTTQLRWTWAAISICLVILEVVPLPLLGPATFLAYRALKFVLFLASGYLLPLAFRQFNVLNRGFAFATLSAALIEGLQGLIHHGHSFHWYELVLKQILLATGFALAVEARYDHRVCLGPIRVKLAEPSMESNP